MLKESASDEEQLFQKTILLLRKEAEKLDKRGDVRISVFVWTSIASASGDKSDFAAALERAHLASHLPLKAENLAAVVKALAEARRFGEARVVSQELLGMDTYWYAESRMWIARFSGEEVDIRLANEAIEGINSPHLRNEAKADAELLLRRKYHHTGAPKHKGLGDAKALLAALKELIALEDSHRVAPKFTSSYLRLHALELAIRILAKTME